MFLGRVYFILNGDFEQYILRVLDYCYQAQIQSIIVEGGARLLTSFIEANLWDEARVIQNNSLHLGKGLPAPQLRNA